VLEAYSVSHSKASAYLPVPVPYRLEFGPFAVENHKCRGQAKPATFDFLGFTHICRKTYAPPRPGGGQDIAGHEDGYQHIQPGLVRWPAVLASAT
jgi:hypothetical protein